MGSSPASFLHAAVELLELLDALLLQLRGLEPLKVAADSRLDHVREHLEEVLERAVRLLPWLPLEVEPVAVPRLPELG